LIQRRRERGATAETVIDPLDYSNDPDYAKKPLSFFAARAVAEFSLDRQARRRAIADAMWAAA
jgi:hypothetical protein